MTHDKSWTVSCRTLWLVLSVVAKVSATVQADQARLTVTDGYNQVTQKTLSQEATVWVLNTSDNLWLVTPAGKYLTCRFADLAVPHTSAISSVIVYVEHHEDRGFKKNKLTWDVGTGWPNTPVVWRSKNNIPIRTQTNPEAVDSWDITAIVNTIQKLNALELRIHNNDTSKASYTDHVYVNVVYTRPPNRPPVADAGPDHTVTDTNDTGEETVLLDGSASSDPDGTITHYRWTEGATLLGTSSTVAFSFVVGTHIVSLQVTDNEGATAVDTVTVTVHPSDYQQCNNGVCDRGESAATCSLDCRSPHSAHGPFSLGAALVTSASLDLFNQAAASFIWPGVPFEWKRIEVSEDVFDFTGYDRLLQPFAAYPVQIIGRIVTGSCWSKVVASSDCTAYSLQPSAMPRDMQDFHRFVCETVTRYKDFIHYWQLIDEPYGCFTGTSAQLVDLQRQFYLAVKECDPSSTVLPGSFNGRNGSIVLALLKDMVAEGRTSEAFGIYQRILVQVTPRDFPIITEQQLPNLLHAPEPTARIDFISYFLANARDYFDVFSFHDYRNFNHIGSWEEELEIVKARVNKPLLILTAVGSDPNVTRAGQAIQVPKRLVITWSEGCDKALWWSFVDMPNSTDPMNSWSGLIRSDLTPKPGYYTYKLLGARMSGVSTVEKLPLAGIYAYKFTRLDGSFFLVIWNETATTTLDLTGHVVGDSVKVTHIITADGQQSPVTEWVPTNGVTVSPEPIFVDVS